MHAAGMIKDISRRKAAPDKLWDFLKMQNFSEDQQIANNQLLQAEKMASIGLIAAGVAHEINRPIGYINSNLCTLEKYLQKVFAILDVQGSAEGTLAPEARETLLAMRQEIGLDFLREDIGLLMLQSREGITRVNEIVQNLAELSIAGEQSEWHWADLHAGIDHALAIAAGELKFRCEVRKAYGRLPKIECLQAQLTRVFANLLRNAGQAIESRGTVTIRSGMAAQDRVWVEIEDNGEGIAPATLKRIFDPYFTTKPLGKGAGLGLSLAYGIVRKHHGKIEVTSRVGRGSTFRVTLPVRHARANPAA